MSICSLTHNLAAINNFFYQNYCRLTLIRILQNRRDAVNPFTFLTATGKEEKDWKTAHIAREINVLIAQLYKQNYLFDEAKSIPESESKSKKSKNWLKISSLAI